MTEETLSSESAVINKMHAQKLSSQDNGEVLRAREECFCTVMDILLAGMDRSDKPSKDAAKSLLLAMEKEIDNSISLLVYNAYVRKYNISREQYCRNAADTLKTKTINMGRAILENMGQKASTIRIKLPPAWNTSESMQQS